MHAKIDLSEGEEVDFENQKEEWNVYKLADGTTLKVKLVLVNVVRSRDKYDPLGNPIYGITSQNIVKVLNVPEKLKRKP
ncbi:MAG: hypothetical protein ACE5J6_04440 [Candidatus Bathyarchaeia archaeon]